jgi:OH-DDVA meta-cleavage compound hydrolase
VFQDFPKLKIIVSPGGGAFPYQLGRFEAPSLRRGSGARFSDALRLLIKTVGVDRCLFGTECPGTGSSIDPATGRSMDNVKPMVENIETLSAADKQKIFCDNAKAVFNLKV